MSIAPRCQVGRTIKRLLMVSAAMPLVACTNVPAPKFVERALPGVFASQPAKDPTTRMLEAEAEVETIFAEVGGEPATTQIADLDQKQPEIFQSTDMAMWDGRPAIGDIWVSVPNADQPERVVIRNEGTGLEVKGAMFVRQEADEKAPIKLSPGAAKALGLGPMELARVSIVAVRKQPKINDASSVMIARRQTDSSPQRSSGRQLESQGISNAPVVSIADPYLRPTNNDDGFVEVAQAVVQDGAIRVHEQLTAAEIPAEIQEDFVDGRSFYRVFASTAVDRNQLSNTLRDIRFTGAEGSDDGTLIGEMPDFSSLEPLETAGPKWMSVGVYNSRNEALSIVQKMARKAIPGEVCSATKGGDVVYRVFAGPAKGEGENLTQQEVAAAHIVENRSFCMGVAAAEGAARLIENARPVRAPLNDERGPAVPHAPDGAVRIRVGEATGSLKLRIPNPYSAPVQIPVAGYMLSLPTNTPPELVNQIRAQIEQMHLGQTTAEDR